MERKTPLSPKGGLFCWELSCFGVIKQESYKYIDAKISKKKANSPLDHSTLASVKTWGIQQELVICRHKGKENLVCPQTFFY
jgi:hypothetical protein